MDLDIPTTTTVSVVCCVSLYIAGLDVIENKEQPDLTATLFLAWVVFLSDRLRINMRMFNRLWIFIVAVGVYYMISQAMMFYVWHPFWQVAEEKVNAFYETSFVYSIYNKFPSFVVFMRRQSMAIFKLSMMIFVTYKTLICYVTNGYCSDYEEGIHKNALRDLLTPVKNTSSAELRRRTF